MTDSHSNARAAAAAMLAAVLRRRRPLDETLAAAMRPKGALAEAEPRDRAFARLLVATTLRRLGQIDAVLADCLERPLPPEAADERDLLRIGAAQLLFLGTPAHAAVDGAMQLARPASRYRGLVNAVLRRLAREGAGRTAAQDAARLNTPDWLWQRWVAAYGEPTVRRIAAAHMAEPPLDLTPRGAADDWVAPLAASLLPTGTLRRAAGGTIESLPGFAEGAWWVQDAAAALPVRLLGAVAGKRVIDLCAAPGGKTAQLAAAGAEVIAVDRSPRRLARLRENLARLHLTAETVEADATIWTPLTLADALVLDAPCSATGTIRRNPDIAWLKQPDDIPSLTVAQARLLDAAVRMVRPGGMLVYCVCSLEPEEGPAQIARLLAEHAELTRLPVDAQEIGGLAEAITAEGDLRTLPCHLAERGGMDGFFASRLIRQE